MHRLQARPYIKPMEQEYVSQLQQKEESRPADKYIFGSCKLDIAIGKLGSQMESS